MIDKIIFFVLILVVSCSSKKEGTPSHEIFIPKELLGLNINHEDSVYFESMPKFESGIKLVSIIDANCTKCIVQNLSKMDSLFSAFMSHTNIYYVLNVQSSDSLYVLNNFIPQIKSKANILWDNDYHFENQNNILSKNPSNRTFMLDEKNRILAVGNPLADPSILKIYKKWARQ